DSLCGQSDSRSLRHSQKVATFVPRTRNQTGQSNGGRQFSSLARCLRRGSVSFGKFQIRTADDQAYVVRVLVAPATSILFMSDSGAATEQQLMAQRLHLRSDIIVKGQNHSGGSGSDAFLDAVKPRLIIASSREFPSYERVSDQWAENLQKRGIKLFRQDQTGAVILRFRQGGWEAQSYFTGEIFRSSSE